LVNDLLLNTPLEIFSKEKLKARTLGKKIEKLDYISTEIKKKFEKVAVYFAIAESSIMTV
jgi:hypothetical protein